MKTYSIGLLVILGVCGLEVACTVGDDDAVPQATGGAAGRGGASWGSSGKSGNTGTSAAGAGEGGAAEVGADEATRRARCEEICSIVPVGDDPWGTGIEATGDACGRYDECVAGLCDAHNPPHASECRAAQDALLPCLLALSAEKFYCENDHLAIDYAGYYFCNDAFLSWGLYCPAP